jgi:hypothetical protein
MKNLDGYNIPFDFDGFVQMSDLIYYDGPLLSHFVSKTGKDYLFYWVDIDEKFNRWMFFRVTPTVIQSYLDKKLSLREIICGLEEGFVSFVEIDDEANFLNPKIVKISSIPEEYLPSSQSYYCFEKYDYNCLDSVSKELKSGVLELHIEGNGVGYGSISLRKLSKILPQFEAMRKDLAAGFNKRCLENFSKKTNGETKKSRFYSLKQYTDFDIHYMMAGSARLILKPKSKYIASCISDDERDLFAREFIKVINSGFNSEEVNNVSKIYGENLIQKYSEFVDLLNEEQLGVKFTWCNAFLNKTYSSKIDKEQVSFVRSALQSFVLNDDSDEEEDGFFTSLNVKTGSFTFETGEHRTIEGRFDDSIMNNIHTVSFCSKYTVTINCSRKAYVGSKVKKKYVLLAYTKV